MSQVTVTLVVSEKTYDLTKHVAAYVKSLKLALADGWQPGTDLPVLLQETLAQGFAVMQDVGAIAAEKDANPTAFANTLALGAVEIGLALLK